MDLATIQHLIAENGYWALFVGTFLEGETFFILAGVAARKGLLNPYYVALIAMAGGFIGDQFFFALGRWRGMDAVTWSRSMARKAVEARRHIRRHAVLLILLSRFSLRPAHGHPPGLRHGRHAHLALPAAQLRLRPGLVHHLRGHWLSFSGGSSSINWTWCAGLQVLVLVLVAVLAVSYLVMRAVKRRLHGRRSGRARQRGQAGLRRGHLDRKGDGPARRACGRPGRRRPDSSPWP